ncbi:MAG TPA: HEAT repeat domain-containing protein, partial [Planctomycetota bacterium]|nr:HEAT repeat domain-containing protein [Planctomycetota bacterium]
ANAKGSGSEALVDRVDETNARIDDIEDEIRALRGSAAGGRGLPAAEPAMPSAPAAAEEMPPAEVEPDPAPAGGAAPGPVAAKAPSDAVKRCVALLKDKEIGVRFAAALELGKIAGKRAPSGEGAATDTADFDYAWPALALSLRKDDDAFVRRACARSLGEIKAWDAFPELAESLLDPEEYVALQASRVLKEMAGQDFGFRQNQAKADRKRVADRAKKWWEENKARIPR